MKVRLPKATNSHNGNNKMKIKITSNKIKAVARAPVAATKILKFAVPVVFKI